MRKIIQEKLYFVFRDSDGALAFTIRSYDGEPDNPRFLFDGDRQAFLLRRPGQVILLDALEDKIVNVLKATQKVRFLETPEDSSEIVRQYDIAVTGIDRVGLAQTQIVPSDDAPCETVARPA